MSIEKYGPKSCYKSNSNLKRSGVQIEMTAEEIEEYTKCHDDIIYFTENYVKIVTLDDGFVNFNPYEYQKKAISLMDANRFSIFLMARQMGKALDVETPIPTPDGFKRMGDIQVGDKVFGRDGKPYNVSFATDYQHNRDCYKILFDDGTHIIADAEHIWTVHDKTHRRRDKNSERDLTTKQMLDAGIFMGDGSKKYSIKNTSPVLTDKKDLPIDPYLFGYWLGDGDSSRFRVTSHVDDTFFKEYCDTVEAEYSIIPDKRGYTVCYQTLYGYTDKLKRLGVLGNKHIPDCYLWSSVDDRKKLLCGLMDSDGNSSEPVNGRKYNNLCEFSNKNETLIDSFMVLCSSLGLKPKKTKKIIKGVDYYLVRFTTYSDYGIGAPFMMKRKSDRIGPRGNFDFTTSRLISSIEKVESRPVKCIQVDSPDHIFLCGEQFLPTHNTTVVAAYLLHAAIFNKDFNIIIIANKYDQANEVLDRIQKMYEDLPWFLQPGVTTWNKKSIKLGNGTRVQTRATSTGAARGQSINIVYLDEFAFVDNDVAFYTSTYPVITAGKSTKVIITSTPNGMNQFYKLWTESVQGKNQFVNYRVDWHHHPDRDDAWKQTQLKNMTEKQFLQEFCNEFFGSSDTLISGSKLEVLTHTQPLEDRNGLKIYEHPKKDVSYVACVDVSEGIGKDYSVISVFDVSKMPYRQVAIYRSNDTPPLKLARNCKKIGDLYNQAYMVVESNSVGSTVCNALWYDLEYENLLQSTINNAESEASQSNTSELGLRMTAKTKQVGCSNLKDMIESDVLVLNDEDSIKELSYFIKQGTSYKAEKNKNDDIVMTMVAFAWFSNQTFFAGMTDLSTREELLSRMSDEDFMPIGFFDDGTSDNNISMF